MICQKCGFKNEKKSIYCIHCGAKLEKNPVNDKINNNVITPNNNIVTIACFFLGLILPIIGLVLFFVYRKKMPNYAKASLIGTIVFIVSLIFFSIVFRTIFSHNVHGIPYADYLAKYIGKKYDDKCVYYGTTGAATYGTYASIYLKCEKLGDNRIMVEANYTKNESERVIKDNYLKYKFDKQTKDYFETKIKLFFNSFYMTKNVIFVSSLNDGKTSFNEFLKDSNFDYMIHYNVRRSDYTSIEQIKKLAESISNDVSNFELYIAILEDDSFDKYNFDGEKIEYLYSDEYKIYTARKRKGDSGIEYYTYEDDFRNRQDGLYY